MTTQLPYPPISGGTIKSFHLLRHYSEKYKLRFACFLKNKDADQLEIFKSKVPLESYKCIALNNRRNVINLLKSYLLSKSFNSFRNRSKNFKKIIETEAALVDAIFVDHYEMFQYVPKDFSGKLIFHSHNAEFLLWRRMSFLERNPIKKAILYIESLRVHKLEKSIISGSDIVFASPNDIVNFKKSGIESLNYARTYHLGNTALLKEKSLEFSQSEKALLFIGTLSWEPNIQGLLWFIKEVWPRLRKAEPDVVLYLVGDKADNRLKKHAKTENIVFCGFIEDLEGYFQKARLAIVPLQFGSGMKVKVLDFMYRGLPLLTTSVGAEGIELVDSDEAFIVDSAEEFAKKTIRLLNDETNWTNFSRKSRQKAKEKYTWEPMFHHMDKVMDKVLG